MAERRMFSKRLTNSARFIKMPSSTQNLYFHLGLNADDDGIVEAFSIMNQINATEDDLKILVAKNFVVVLNEDLVSYIVDWRENNKLRADRKVDSIYKDLLLKVIPEVQLLESKERADRKKEDIEISTFYDGTSHGQPMDGIGKDSIGKDNDRLDILNNKINILNIVRKKVLKTGCWITDKKLNEKFEEMLKYLPDNPEEYLFSLIMNEVKE
ncbi:MAG: hypothetical protein ACI4ON_00310 [Clostridia bacterium]